MFVAWTTSNLPKVELNFVSSKFWHGSPNFSGQARPGLLLGEICQYCFFYPILKKFRQFLQKFLQMKAHMVVNYSETKVHEINSQSQKIFSKDKLLYYAENGLQRQTH
jgi:hypothetical protein